MARFTEIHRQQLADLDHVGEHVLDATEPRDEVARSGWVGVHQQIISDLLVGGDRQTAGVVDFADIESKRMSTGLVRKSAILSGKVTPLGETIELHEEPWISPYLARQLTKV
jgi:hypothetical protein